MHTKLFKCFYFYLYEVFYSNCNFLQLCILFNTFSSFFRKINLSTNYVVRSRIILTTMPKSQVQGILCDLFPVSWLHGAEVMLQFVPLSIFGPINRSSTTRTPYGRTYFTWYYDNLLHKDTLPFSRIIHTYSIQCMCMNTKSSSRRSRRFYFVSK